MPPEPFDPDPEVKVREWFKENIRRRSSEEAAERRMKQMDRTIPHGILDAPATEINCQNLAYVLTAMEENAGGNVGAKSPEEIDMSPFKGAETVGGLFRRYLSQHVTEDTSKVNAAEEDSAEEVVSDLLVAFGDMLSDTWDEHPPEAERRRWVATMRLTWPPRLLYEQEEIARLTKNLPGRD